MKKIVVALSLALTLSGCTLFYTDYKEPEFPKVASFKDAQKFLGEAICDDYFKAFNDSNLTKAIEIALKQNYDIKKAFVNVKKALLNVDIVATDKHPSMEANLGAQTKRALDHHDKSVKTSSSNFAISYQADLFGKINAQDESAKTAFEATAYDYKAMRLTIIEATAKAYWQYAYAKEAVKIGEDDLKDSFTRLNLVNQKFQAGAANSLDVDDAHINHLKVQAQLDIRRANFAKAKTALNTMLGFTADTDITVSALDDASIPEFSTDVPLKLLKRRPDLLKDEALLKQAYADYNLAKVSFFPDFTLKAAITGGDTNTFANFFANPIGALGATATMPFLNFNELSLRKNKAYKDIEWYELNFVSDYINAVAEVYDEITNVDLYQKSLMTYKHSYELAVRNYARYEQRYQSGLVSLTDFLSSADTMRNAKIIYLEAKLNNLNTTITLMTALGGDNTKDLTELTNKALDD